MFKRFLVGILAVMVMAGVANAGTRCFTFTGQNRTQNNQLVVNSVNAAYNDSRSFFYAWGLRDVGTELTYEICIDDGKDGTNLNDASVRTSNIFPVGGTGEPNNPLAYPRTDGELNTYYPDGFDGSAARIQVGSDFNEYVVFYNLPGSFDDWKVGDAMSIQHTSFIDFEPDWVYNGNTIYDWVTRVYAEGTITAIDPVPEPSVETLDTDFCNKWQVDGWQCLGKLTLESMGEFNPDGSFNWNGPEAAELLAWAAMTPNGVDTPYRQFNVNGGTFSLRHTSEGAYVKVMTEIGEEIIGNEIVKANCFDPNMCGEGIGYFVTPMPPEGCDGEYVENAQECVDAAPELYPDGWFNPRDDHPLPCCRIWPNRPVKLYFNPVSNDDVAEVLWVEKNAIGNGKRVNSDGIFPKYKLYPINFWDFDNAWEKVYEEYYVTFPLGMTPEADSVQTMRFTLTNGDVIDRQYRISDVAPMPVVSATKETVDGTKITINAKEKKIGLMITWNDPPFKEIMKPGIQLRTYIGNGLVVDDVQVDRFFFIDSPTQMHKILVPKSNWVAFKDELLAKGHTEADMILMYRTNIFDEEFNTNYQNRGQSDVVAIPLQ